MTRKEEAKVLTNEEIAQEIAENSFSGAWDVSDVKRDVLNALTAAEDRGREEALRMVEVAQKHEDAWKHVREAQLLRCLVDSIRALKSPPSPGSGEKP